MKFIGLILLSLFCIKLNGQSIFQKTFGTTNYEEAWGGTTTSDSGFIFSGYTNFDNSYIIKLRSNGDTTWIKNINGGGVDLLYSVQQTNDKGFIFAGRTNGFGAGGQDMFLIKTDTSGNNQWTQAIGGTSDETVNSVKQTLDGGFILAGNTYSFGAGLNDLYIVKVNTSGIILWTKSIGGAGNENAYSIIETTDSSFVVVGLTTSFGAGDKDIVAVKISKNGNIIWAKTFGGAGDDRANSIQETTDGGFIIGGVTSSFGAGNYDFNLIKIDFSGNFSWEKTFGGLGDEWAYSIQETNDMGFVLAGYTNSFGAGNSDYYIVKTNLAGDTIWTKTFGGTMAEYATSVIQTPDNGYAIFGYGQSFGAGDFDFYFVKTDTNGNGICNQNNSQTSVNSPIPIITNPSFTTASGGVQFFVSPIISGGTIINSLCTSVGTHSLEYKNSKLYFYPNPTAETFTVELPEKEAFGLLISDIMGRLIYERKNATGTITIDASDFSSGVYFVKAVNERTVLTGKLIKE